MDTTTLGRSGLRVSRLCLGTMNFGTHTSPDDAKTILDRALDAGVHYIDTANGYPSHEKSGLTEEIIGEWIEDRGNRDRIVLATKVYGKMGPGPNDRGLSAYNIRQACEASLRRLRTDRIDLYQMHHVDRSVPWDEIAGAMDVLIRQGKILYVGSSNFGGWHIATACQEMARRGMVGLVSEQSKYSLAVRQAELEVVPACRHYGLGLVPYSPLAGGLLGGALDLEGDEGRRADEGMRRRVEQCRDRLEAYDDLCRELGHPPAHVALAWLLASPAVTAPIIGPRTVEQLEDVLEVPMIRLDRETLARLDEIWPGPGGEAPEAYAW